MRPYPRLLCFLAFVFVFVFPITPAGRPENILSDHSCYSDTYRVDGVVHDIGGEKNHEEVYQLHTYYEIIYDETESVVVFREYQKGTIIRVEGYGYGAEGALLHRIVARPVAD